MFFITGRDSFLNTDRQTDRYILDRKTVIIWLSVSKAIEHIMRYETNAQKAYRNRLMSHNYIMYKQPHTHHYGSRTAFLIKHPALSLYVVLFLDVALEALEPAMNPFHSEVDKHSVKACHTVFLSLQPLNFKAPIISYCK